MLERGRGDAGRHLPGTSTASYGQCSTHVSWQAALCSKYGKLKFLQRWMAIHGTSTVTCPALQVAAPPRYEDDVPLIKPTLV